MTAKPADPAPSRDRDRVLDQIRKLINYAKDGSASEGEVENALGHARRLMAKFNIDEQDILLQKSGRQSAYDSIVEISAFSRAGSLDVHDKDMAPVCDYLFETKHFWQRRHDPTSGKLREHMVFYGLPADVKVAVEFYQDLLTIKRAMAHASLGQGWSRRHTDYALGFSHRLVQRAREIREEEKQNQASTSVQNQIILAKDALLIQYTDTHLRLKVVPQKSREVSAAYSLGKSHAEKVHMGPTGKVV